MTTLRILSIIFISIFLESIAFSYEMDIGERIECGVTSAIKHNIPADILLAISTIENGEAGVGYRNKNGSIDYGIMQINSVYIKELKDRYNIIATPEEIMAPTCYSFDIAAFKISEHLKNDSGSFLARVAAYHSRTEDLNRLYQTKLIEHSSQWRKIFVGKKYLTYLWQPNKGGKR